ncbi:MAG TPA: ABC transporter permease [Candidatus Limnocylindria bacterium]|nr:ABC transporter permease [Candidatus Limnocylindria bacterium]
MRGPLAHGALGAVATAVLVAWLVRAILENASLETLTLNLLLRGVDPFRGMALEQALAVSVGRSLVLVVAALAAATVLGLALAAAFAFSSSGVLRGAAWAAGTVGVSLPSFFWAMLLQLAVVLWYVRTQQSVLPTQGFGIDAHLILPALALGARPAAYVFRTAATALDEVRHGDFVRTARAKGLLESLVARRHVLPNALPQIASGFGLAARSALSSLAIVEYVFAWHGAGYGFIHAVANGRADLAAAIAVAFAVVFGLVTALVGAFGRAFDPRLARA